ncbi:MAG: class I SAM-dependent methyltransferase [Methylococcaceae bacterium]|nr:class I SAM-dependent methyltransferase [Methylococcaceae bacterium]
MKIRLGLALALSALAMPASAQDKTSQEKKAAPHRHPQQQSSHQIAPGAANAHLHRMSFQEMVERFEVAGRETWQKPEEVIDLLGNIHAKTVLDLGAGTGYFSVRLARHGAKVIAADVDKRFLDFIQTRAKAEGTDGGQVITRLIPYDNPGLSAAEVDAVLMVDVYHHIENRPAYFAKLRAGMKPGAPLLIVDFHPNKNNPEGPPPELRIAPKDVETELRKAGFTQFDWKEDWLEYQYVLIVR